MAHGSACSEGSGVLSEVALDALLIGLQAALAWPVLLALAAGSVLGLVVGVLPGIGPGVAISLLLPLTYGMSPLAGITLLLGIYCGAFYGGAVTSILIRTPGEASSIMTMFDGYPMARRGEAERALSLAFASAFIGGIASVVALILLATPVAAFTARFGAAEYAASAMLALVCVSRAYRGQFFAAAMMVGLGLFIATIGIDPTSNDQRYTFGATALLSGLPLVPLVIGLFGVAQAAILIGSRAARPQTGETSARAAGVGLRHMLEPFRYPGTLSKSVGIGVSIGVLPAVGAALSTTLAYFEARRASKNPEAFGNGSPEGIVAAEAANNSNSGGAMLTVLTLGIPGDAVTAMIMGVFIVHGVVPGPALFIEQPALANGILAVMLLINVFILGALFVATRYLAMLSRVDPGLLGMGILMLCLVGAYSVGNSMAGVWVALGAGVFGWLCAHAGIPVVPLVLGVILGDMLESTMRQALSISDGSLSIFVHRPVAAAILAATVAMLLWPLILRAVRWRQ